MIAAPAPQLPEQPGTREVLEAIQDLRSHVDTRIEQLRSHFDARLDRFDERLRQGEIGLAEVKGRIDGIDKRIDGVDKRISDLSARIPSVWTIALLRFGLPHGL